VTGAVAAEGRRLIRAAELKHLLGNVGDTTLWRMVRDGKLPAPRYLGVPGRARRIWFLDEVQALLEKQLGPEPQP
jgi:predicted DNA-binding transcriptional regulator AlpA